MLSSLRRLGMALTAIVVSAFVFSGCSVSLPWQKSISGLQVQVTDGGSAQIFLDDLHLGQSPIQQEGLKPGVYTLRIEPELSDKQAYETQIRLYPGSITSALWSFAGDMPTGTGDILELEPLPTNTRAELSVITVPEGASVLLNDTTYGLSPVILDEIEPGEYSLTINAVGHVRKTLPVQVQPGYRLHIFSRLETDTAQNIIPDPTPTPDASADSSDETDTDTTASTTPPGITPDADETSTPAPSSARTRSQTTLPEKPYVTITETGTGWLRVRSEASSAGEEVARVDVGTNHPYKSTLNGWYEIEYAPGQTGWISGQYGTIIR
ncbi:PEGA domain-containing protein [Candidatus Woesebacteria bacterium]|nr:PEGA domain-containing protein [Candidatus Woesebacteria bacterium]MCD8507073.1 PEGA domain-containing protein [Candidatus Woesebacteria bacterium]MCD8527194.1 PEGA domain-containing protein [Candidatus Woesebacteria bacterium]MCD8546559.1 PEGA domain-containing protein [Candidatus Woesebacteria bacterium]